MEINRCYGCMAEVTQYPCVKCGYDPEKNKMPDYALRPGLILNGKYMIGKVLGQGGFGITYVGWDLALERKVAIKEYFPTGQVSRYPGTTVLQWYSTEQSNMARQSGTEMFLKEARKMSRVDDIEQVVRVRDLFRENDTAYIIMDFVEGENLKDRLTKTGPLNWEEAKKIFLPVIEAMEKVHQAGLIHRDISPDNLMLTPDGKVKILDLGAAKDLNVNSGASSMQVAKSGFSPLEQYTQRGGSGTWTDVYAMAATMYYALTGKLPPAAVDRVESDSLRWDLPQLQTLPPKALSALIQAMALHAKDRTHTMAELGRVLFAKVPAAKEDPKPRPKPESRPAKKRSKWLIPVAAVLVVLYGIGIWAEVIKPANHPTVSLSAGSYHTVALRCNGKVVATGWNKDSQCDVSDWKDIMAVAAGEVHTVGLRSDGTVVTTGWNNYGQCNVSDWTDIVAVAAGRCHTVALRSDGTVVATGDNISGRCNVSDWKDIVAVAAGSIHTVGLRSDGTVVTTGWNKNGQCNVSDWSDIVAVAAGQCHTVALRSDGTVVATGWNKNGQCNVSDWTDIVAVAAGSMHTVGLRSDGTVVATGWNNYGQCNVSDWKDIVAVAAGSIHTVGLRSDGTVVATGSDSNGQCRVSNWKNIRTP